MQGLPIFGKVEVWVKNGNSTIKSEYIDSGILITGDYLIIVKNETMDGDNTITSTGTLFNLSELIRYKTYTK